MRNTILLELDKNVYNTILSYGIDISKYVLNISQPKMTETEYITSTKANKEALDKSIKEAENGETISLEDLLK